MWNCTLQELKPYIEYQKRQLILREAIIAFICGDIDKEERMKKEYCEMCKKKGVNDCKNCKLEVISDA